jgi:long-chain fatty acid transport protein
VPGLPDPIPVAGGGGGNPFDPLIPLSNLYFAMPADNDGLWVGLGVTSPFGLNNKYDGGFFGRYDSRKSLLFTLNIQPTVAYNISPEVSLGAGLDIQYADVTLNNALPNLDPAVADGFFEVEGQDWTLGFNVGIHADLGALQLGAHYRSGIDHNIRGTVTNLRLLGFLQPLNGSAGASAALNLPDIVSGGLVYQVPDAPVRVLWDFTWFNWSSFEEIRIVTGTGAVFEQPQNYRDTWSFALGGEYDVNERLTLRAGTQFDQTPTRDAFRTTRVPDGDRWWAAVGATYRFSPRFSAALSYAHVFVSTERIDLVETFFEGTPAAIEVRTLSDNSGSADIIALGVSARF